MMSSLTAVGRVIVVAGLVPSLVAVAQSSAHITRPEPAMNAAYVELGGPGGFLSANYERYIDERFSARAGVASWSITNLDNLHESMTSAIGSLSARWDISDFVGKGEGRFAEAGLAVSAGTYSRSRYSTLESEGSFVTLLPMAGLRYQLPQGGWMFRLTFTPYVPVAGRYVPLTDGPDLRAVAPGASLSGGYAF